MLLSIDPGKSGAFALFSLEGELLRTEKMKTTPKRRFFGREELQQVIDMLEPGITVVVMEAFLDQRMHKQSPVATNTTACNHGMQQATVLLNSDAELHLVRPRHWKARMGLIGMDKGASVELARDLVCPSFLRKPRMRVDNIDIAEAVLIGIQYGNEHLNWRYKV